MMVQAATSRRDFLCLGAAAAAAACGGCAISGSRKAGVAVEPKQGAVRLTEAQSTALLASKGSILLKPKGVHDKILVVHPADNTLHAVSAICTHMGCTVDYNKDIDRIDCPCHGSRFAVDGSVIQGPAKRPLKQYDVTTENGQVLIKV
jgi:cytochrome b6-f complex iron-sulfur subunit